MATPQSSAEPRTVADLEAELREMQAHTARLERALETTSRELSRIKQSSSWRVTEPLRAAKAKLGGRR
ncbi:MAG TPA: hypothetical protein VHB53_05645 [Solirubrobacterales bacterium]|nr:hypothetical protein [Solirubrobacterales bacterium]